MIQLNKKSRVLRLTRKEVTDIMLALDQYEDDSHRNLRNKIREQFDRQDEKDPDYPRIAEE